MTKSGQGIDHWECTCGIVNHLSREKCLGCDKPRPSELSRKLKARKLKFYTKSRKEMSQVEFQEEKSKCFKCCGSKLCKIHKKMKEDFGFM